MPAVLRLGSSNIFAALLFLPQSDCRSAVPLARYSSTQPSMPELPEVETSRAYVEEFCLGSMIVKCHATEQGGGPRDGQFDELVIGEDVTPRSLKSSLEGRTIVDLKRRGKQMWFVLDKPPHPLFHFGMTGAFTIKGEKRHNFVKFKVAENWPPRFTKLELQMSNGACLALTDPRRLSRVRLRAEPETSPPISLLGPDPITHPIPLDVFAAALAKPTAPIKAVLLAQDRVISGVGNWIADEVCFQACVHPGAACNTLAPDQVTALHARLLSVCRQACAARADYSVFPEDWLFHHRWGKGKTPPDGAPRVSSGHPIHFDVVGGRTTAIVLAVQRKGLLPASSGDRKAAAPGKGRKSKAKAGSRGSANGSMEERGEEEGGGETKLGGDGVPKEELKTAAAAPKANSRSRTGEALVGKRARLLPNSAEQTSSKVKYEATTKARPRRVKPEATKAKSRGKAKAARKGSLEVAVKAKTEASAAAARTKRSILDDDRTAAVADPRAGKRSKRAVAMKSADTPAAAEAADGSCPKLSIGRRSPRLASIVEY